MNQPPSSDVIYQIDNEQKFVGRRCLQQTDQLSLVTNVSFVSFEETLQFDAANAPKAFTCIADYKAEEAVAQFQGDMAKVEQLQQEKDDFKSIIEEIIAQRYAGITDYECTHKEQLLRYLQTTLDQVSGSHITSQRDTVDEVIEKQWVLNCKWCSKCNTFYPSRTRNC